MYYKFRNAQVVFRNAKAVLLSKRYITMLSRKCLDCNTKLALDTVDQEIYVSCPKCNLESMFGYAKASRAVYYFYCLQIRF